MKTDSGLTLSTWMETEVTKLSPLAENTSAEVCIIGAGIAGLSTAYLLTREGHDVVVLDDGPIGGGNTSRTTAHLTNVIDDRYFEVERLHGEEGARLACESHTAAIDLIEAIISDEQIKCEFLRLEGYLFTPPRQSRKILDDELSAARRAGLLTVEKVDRAPIDFDTGPALRFPNQAQFHPIKYLNGLANAITQRGGRIYTPAHAEKIQGGNRSHVTTSGGFTVEAKAIVVATNTPVNDLVAIHTKQAPYMTYVIAARIPRGSVTRALFWDTPDPYHYVRLRNVGRGANAYDLLIVGGEDHKTGQRNDGNRRFAALERWARARFPMIESVEYHWSGQVMEPVDALAFIGRNPMDAANVYIATGDSGQGMTHGTIAGILLTDLILGHDNPWTKLYDPNRVTLRAFPEFVKENLNVAAQYTDFVMPPEVDSVEQIKRETGAIIARNGKKIAAYRDDAGVLHERSAICRHLGCIVSWNGAEKSWDCPCHSSRYDAYGRVFQGPANSGLPEADVKAEAPTRRTAIRRRRNPASRPRQHLK